MDEIQQTAREWTRGLKTDLERIDAICRKLREGYRYNPDRVVPEGCANPVRWFLLESREGPDYLFATASVLLMRSLGISCRAVSGLYADPAHYDLSARQTSVFPDDTHWWAEVYLGNGSWLTVEPTPGYATLAPPRSLLLHVWVMLYKTGQLLARHWIATATILLLLGIMACYSRQLGLMFRITTLAWRYRQVTTAQALRLLVLQSVRLWDRQLELNQQSRPQGTTFPRFLRQQLLKTPESNLSETEAALLIEIYQWAAFSDQPVFPGEVNFQQIRHLCFQLLKPPQQTLLRQRLLRRNSAQTKQKVLPL